MATEPVTEEFKQLKCQRCGKTFEIAVEDTKSRKYSKRCDTCRVSKTSGFDKQTRKKQEVWPTWENAGHTDKANYPVSKEASYETFELFDGIKIEINADVPPVVRNLMRSEVESLIARVKTRTGPDFTDEDIRRVIARLLSRRDLAAIEGFLKQKSTVNRIAWAVVNRQDDEKDSTEKGLSELLHVLQKSGRVSEDAVRFFIEKSVNKRSLRDISASAGVSKSQIGRMVNEVVSGLHEQGPSEEIAILLESCEIEYGIDEGYPVDKDRPRRRMGEKGRTKLKDEFQTALSSRSDRPIFDDFAEDSTS